MTKILTEKNIKAKITISQNIKASLSEEKNINCNTSIAKGDKGDTPIKGVDYYTEEDKQEIKEIAKEEAAKEIKSLVNTINNELEKIGLDINKLNETDSDLKASLENIIRKMEDLVRYSKGEIHNVIIY